MSGLVVLLWLGINQYFTPWKQVEFSGLITSDLFGGDGIYKIRGDSTSKYLLKNNLIQ